MKTWSQLQAFIEMWSGKRDSNSRPQPWQGCALPTELFPRCVALSLKRGAKIRLFSYIPNFLDKKMIFLVFFYFPKKRNRFFLWGRDNCCHEIFCEG